MRQPRERGASAVEYGLLIAAVAAVIAVLTLSLGGIVSQAFASHSACLSAQMNSTAC